MLLGGSNWPQREEWLSWKHGAWLRIMDIKDRRHRSLTRGRCGKQCRYTSSSLDSEDCRVPTQKSYSSSETLKAYDHDTRMHYGNRVSDLVHRESDEFPRQGMFKARTGFFYGNPWWTVCSLLKHVTAARSFNERALGEWILSYHYFHCFVLN